MAPECRLAVTGNPLIQGTRCFIRDKNYADSLLQIIYKMAIMASKKNVFDSFLNFSRFVCSF